MRSFEELYDSFQNKFQTDNELSKAKNKYDMENKKRKKLALTVCLVIDGLCVIYSLIILKTLIIFTMFPLLIFNLFIYIIIVALFNTHHKEYALVFKEHVIKELIGNFFDNIEYFPSSQMPSGIYDEGLYRETYNRYYSDDYIKTRINDKYAIEMAEVITQHVTTDSDGDTHTETLFHGLFSRIILNKSINCDFRITPNYRKYKDKLEMDSSEFEKLFNVFTTNKIVGMQLLTADIMEEIMQFKSKTKYAFDIFINQNIIYLRFNCGTMFEPTSFKNGILDEKGLRKYYDALDFISTLTNRIVRIINETEI
jgi:hypothetical protein